MFLRLKIYARMMAPSSRWSLREWQKSSVRATAHGFVSKPVQALSAPAYGQVSTFPIRTNSDGTIELNLEDA